MPIAVPDFCRFTSPLNSKKLFFKTKSAIRTISSVDNFGESLSLSLFRSASKPASRDILGPSPITSAVTKIAPSGFLPIFLIFF